MRKLILLLLLVTTGWITGRAYTIDEELYAGIISGRVTDPRGVPLAGATVVITQINTATVADADGYFVFRNIRPGKYQLHITHIGYNATILGSEILESETHLTIQLTPVYIELREVVVRDNVSGIPGTEHSLSLSKVTRDFFSQNPGVTLMQSLENLPGIQSIDIGSGISKPVIRGMSFNRVVVAENNIKQQGQQWGADHGLEIDPWSVERVEVIKGPASLLFGSDAIAGAINIRPPVIPLENTLQASAIFNARSNNDLLGTSVMTAVNNNGNFFRARVSAQSYADYRVPADNFTFNNWVMPITNGRLKNTSGNDQAFSLTGGLRRQWGISSLSLSYYKQVAGFFPGSHGVPNPQSLIDAGNPRQTDYPRQGVNHLKALWNTSLQTGSNWLEVDMGFQQNHRREMNPPHAHGNGPLPDNNLELELILNTLSTGVRFHHNRRPGNSWVYGMSVNMQENSRGGYGFLMPDFRAADAGLFVITKYSPGNNLFFNAGTRADLAHIDIAGYMEPVWADPENISHYNQRSPVFNKSYVNATANAGVSWLPSPEWNFKLNLGSAYRLPSPVELSANGIHHGALRHEMGDTNLRPERAWQIDPGVVFGTKDFYVSLNPYLNYFSNYIFLNPTGLFSPLPGGGQIYRFEQAPALHIGADGYLDLHLTRELHTSVGAEILWARNLDDHYPLPLMPPGSFYIQATYSLPRENQTRFIAAVRRNAAQNRVARNEPATEGYTIFNLGINKSFPLAGLNAELDFHVQNLFNVLYQDHLSFYRKLELPGPGRNFQITIRISLNNQGLFSHEHN